MIASTGDKYGVVSSRMVFEVTVFIPYCLQLYMPDNSDHVSWIVHAWIPTTQIMISRQSHQKKTEGGFGRFQNEDGEEATPMVPFFLHAVRTAGRMISLPFDYETL